MLEYKKAKEKFEELERVPTQEELIESKNAMDGYKKEWLNDETEERWSIYEITTNGYNEKLKLIRDARCRAMGLPDSCSPQDATTNDTSRLGHPPSKKELATLRKKVADLKEAVDRENNDANTKWLNTDTKREYKDAEEKLKQLQRYDLPTKEHLDDVKQKLDYLKEAYQNGNSTKQAYENANNENNRLLNLVWQARCRAVDLSNSCSPLEEFWAATKEMKHAFYMRQRQVVFKLSPKTKEIDAKVKAFIDAEAKVKSAETSVRSSFNSPLQSLRSAREEVKRAHAKIKQIQNTSDVAEKTKYQAEVDQAERRLEITRADMKSYVPTEEELKLARQDVKNASEILIFYQELDPSVKDGQRVDAEKSLEDAKARLKEIEAYIPGNNPEKASNESIAPPHATAAPTAIITKCNIKPVQVTCGGNITSKKGGKKRKHKKKSSKKKRKKSKRKTIRKKSKRKTKKKKIKT